VRGRLFNQARRHTSNGLSPRGRTAVQQWFKLIPSDSVGLDEFSIDQAITLKHMQKRERQRRIAAREGL
jgi:hypothetical protein